MSTALRVRACDFVDDAVEALVHLVTTEDVDAGLDGIDVRGSLLESVGFTGKPNQFAREVVDDRVVAVAGLGPAGDVDPSTLRRVAATVARVCKRHRHVGLVVGDIDRFEVDQQGAYQALTEGLMLGSYRFTLYKSEARARANDHESQQSEDTESVGAPDAGNNPDGNPDDTDDHRLEAVDLVGPVGDPTEEAVQRAARIADGVCLARDLVNEPGGTLTAPEFARRVVELAEGTPLRVKVWQREDIEREGLGGLLGVNRGSTQPPRFVRIAYDPEPTQSIGEPEAAAPDADETPQVSSTPPEADVGSEGDGNQGEAADAGRPPTVALVGKGVTFDAGGLSIKTVAGMMTMKMDMAGAAAVVAAMWVVAHLKPDVAVRAYVPMTDNMLGGDATRPGDVLTIRNGKTIEVVNTDAEGRLILADALSLAVEDEPDAIVDLATLTGACMVALGPKIAGLMGNNDSWISQVRAAADAAGERVWPLPLPKDYESQFKSVTADIKNVGTSHGGALTAGLILQHFVTDDVAWAHLDIAGPAYSDSVDGEVVKGATGFGVRALVELISNFTKPEAT